METTADISIGQVVKSKAGRDKGKIFVVLEIIDDEYVMVTDGSLRKIDKPKKKKIKHLIVFKAILHDLKNRLEAGDKFNNAYVRKLLAPFNEEI